MAFFEAVQLQRQQLLLRSAAPPAARSRQQHLLQGRVHHAAGACAVGILQLLWASFLPTAVAFDLEAHDAIGQTATSAMDQAAIRQVKRLLGGQDPSDVAGWGHQVDDTFPAIEKLHFQPHEGTLCDNVASAPVKCEDNICLVEAIKHFYGRILKDEGRTPEKVIDIDHRKFTSITDSKPIKFTDADAVKMLINLIGDLHQPLALGYSADDMGRNFKVKFRGKELSLYDFWDKEIGEVVRKHESNFWLGGWTHYARVESEFQEDKAAWQKEGAFKMFEKWAEETSKLACEKAYKIQGKSVAEMGSPVEIDEATFQDWRSIWLRQILLAGERTAVVLNDILDAKGAKKLSEGTKIHTKADEAAEEQRKKDEKERKEWQAKDPNFNRKPTNAYVPINAWGNFLTNLMIAAVVIPCFLWVATREANPFDPRVLLEWLESQPSNGASEPQGDGPKYKPGVGKRAN